MRIFTILAFLLSSGCSSLIANFEDDRVGARPSIFPAGHPDDEIRLSAGFQGAVRGFPIIDPTGNRNGRQSLEVIGNSSISFRSKPIPEAQQTGRHTVSFLFTDGTTRGKTISFTQGNGTAVRFRLVDDTMTIRGQDGQDEQEFSIRTIGVASLARIIVDPRTGRTRVSWRTSRETISWVTTFSDPGEERVTQIGLQFNMDNGGNFPRGRIAIDDVRATWTPRITFGDPS